MLLTEADTKFKYCPLLKTRDDKMKFCLGSMCMLWRWTDPDKTGPDLCGYCGAAGPVVAAAAVDMGADPEQRPVEDY